MSEIDYDIDHKKRWGALLADLQKLPLDERKDILLRATDYRSGTDSINSVYMGGIAMATLVSTLNGRYMKDRMEDLIQAADEKTIDKALMCAMHTIEYMLHHPVKHCPFCGQIVRDLTEDAYPSSNS